MKKNFLKSSCRFLNPMEFCADSSITLLTNCSKSKTQLQLPLKLMHFSGMGPKTSNGLRLSVCCSYFLDKSLDFD